MVLHQKPVHGVLGVRDALGTGYVLLVAAPAHRLVGPAPHLVLGSAVRLELNKLPHVHDVLEVVLEALRPAAVPAHSSQDLVVEQVAPVGDRRDNPEPLALRNFRPHVLAVVFELNNIGVAALVHEHLFLPVRAEAALRHSPHDPPVGVPSRPEELGYALAREEVGEHPLHGAGLEGREFNPVPFVLDHVREQRAVPRLEHSVFALLQRFFGILPCWF